MGDFNTEADGYQVQSFCERLSLRAPTAGVPTYPAWQPQRSIDHILVSEGLRASDACALDVEVSDHCPVALTLDLPADIDLAPRAALLSAAG
jgi:endonuclease/exonuclease/phosphatase family metal-dependent hydrolase